LDSGKKHEKAAKAVDSELGEAADATWTLRIFIKTLVSGNIYDRGNGRFFLTDRKRRIVIVNFLNFI
jgi:hypothetical protein